MVVQIKELSDHPFTLQTYNPNLFRIYCDGVGFVPYDTTDETREDQEEREWAEDQLRSERRKNNK